MAENDSQTIVSGSANLAAGGNAKVKYTAGQEKFVSFLELKLVADTEIGNVYANVYVENENEELVREFVEPMNGDDDGPDGYPIFVSTINSPLAVFKEIKPNETLVVEFEHNDGAGNATVVYVNASNAATVRATQLSG